MALLPSVRDRLLLTGVGAALGLLAGLAWWFSWGCRACAAGEQPIRQLAFSAAMGVVLSNAWGMDHLRSRRGHR